jgi:hypothetical protein
MPALGAGMAGQAAGLATEAAAAIPAGAFGGMAGLDTYNSMRDAGKGIAASIAAGLARGTGEFVGETIADVPLLKLMGGETAHAVKAILQQMIIEGTTEAAQQAWQNLVEKIGYEKARPIMEGVLDSGVVGGAMGGMLGGAGVLSNKLATPNIQASVPPEFAKKPQIKKILLGGKPHFLVLGQNKEEGYRAAIYNEEGSLVDSIDGTKTEVADFIKALPKNEIPAPEEVPQAEPTPQAEPAPEPEEEFFDQETQ